MKGIILLSLVVLSGCTVNSYDPRVTDLLAKQDRITTVVDQHAQVLNAFAGAFKELQDKKYLSKPKEESK